MIIHNAEEKSPSAGATIRKTRLYTLVLVGSILLLSGTLFAFAWNRYQNIASKEAVMLAQSMEALLHPEHSLNCRATAGTGEIRL
jgi:hypothetical protein